MVPLSVQGSPSHRRGRAQCGHMVICCVMNGGTLGSVMVEQLLHANLPSTKFIFKLSAPVAVKFLDHLFTEFLGFGHLMFHGKAGSNQPFTRTEVVLVLNLSACKSSYCVSG